MRRAKIRTLYIAAIASAFSSSGIINQCNAAQLNQARRKPNIVFIMADDLGWSDVGYNGAEFYETPNIDALCKSGMEFTSAYPGGANCMPSRACIMSGMYTPRTKMWTPGRVAKGDPRFMRFLVPNQKNRRGDGKIPTKGSLGPSVVSLAHVLKQAGYKTLHLGKWHLGRENPLGFDRNDVNGRGAGLEKDQKFYGNKDVAEWLTDAAVEYIAENKEGTQPFFIYLNHYDVHVPINARDAVVEKYRKKKATQKWNRNWNPVYAAMVEAVDRSVGRVWQSLKANGLEENTLLIFTSDNGGYGGATWNTPLKGSKGSFYEGGIRTPLCISWPGKIKPRTTCHTPVTGVDYMPTFAELAGAVPPTTQPVDGVSIVPLLRGQPLAERSVYWHYPLYLDGRVKTKPVFSTDRMHWRTTPCSVIRHGDWKLIQFFETDTTELYNLKQDPGEQSDLATDHRDKVKELLSLLKAWQTNTERTFRKP
ncbi:MAG: sulfatase [Lacipirellulaceae bacterium]